MTAVFIPFYQFVLSLFLGASVFFLYLDTMFLRNHIKLWLLTIVVSVFSLSCHKDFDKISTSLWQPELAAPFAQSIISIQNIIGNDSNLTTTPDSLLVYIYIKDSAFNLTADSLLKPPDEIKFEKQFSLGAIKASSEQFDEAFTLDFMLDFINQDIADSLRKYDGTMQVFPPFEMLQPATKYFSPSENYEYLTFMDGILLISITNSMPVAFEQLQLKLKDVVSDQIIKEFNIPLLLPDQVFIDSISLHNLTIGNEFAIEITYFLTKGSSPETVEINLEQGFEFSLKLKDAEVIAGKAKIAEQVMTTDTSMIEYNPKDQEKLFHVNFRDGKLDYSLASELAMDAVIEMKFLSALIDGEIPEKEVDLKSGGVFNEVTSVADLSIDFTTNPDQPYNQFPVEFTIILPPTEGMVVFDSSDYVNTTFQFLDIKLAYADGFLGKKEINVNRDTVKLDHSFLDNIKGELILTEPVFDIHYTNEIGMPIRFLPIYIGVNTKTGEEQNLNADSIFIAAPANPGESIHGNIKYDNTNSSVVDFIAIRPDQIIYDGGGFTNGGEEVFNFVYDTARFFGNAVSTIPLMLRSSFISFTDTVQISAGETNSFLKEGELLANVLNGFPLDMLMKLQIRDSVTGEILETVEFTEILSAPVDANGRVVQALGSEITGFFDENFIQNLPRANKAFIILESKTFDNGTVPVGLYSDYTLEVAIGYRAVIKP